MNFILSMVLSFLLYEGRDYGLWHIVVCTIWYFFNEASTYTRQTKKKMVGKTTVYKVMKILAIVSILWTFLPFFSFFDRYKM